MKKNKVYGIIAGILILSSVFVVLFEKGVFLRNSQWQGISDIFAIKDTGNVTKIFLADMQGTTLLLKREEKGWSINDTGIANSYYVASVLGRLHNIAIRQNIAKPAIDNITKQIASGATKMEIYQILPKFTIFGHPFFVKERLSKTYYFGPETQDNLGNYALLEGMSEPYIIHIPGFRGYISSLFTPYKEDWESHSIFTTKITRIEQISFENIDYKNESFTVKKNGPRFFDVYDANNQKLTSYDTTKLLDMVSEFRNLNFESFASLITPEHKDSILQFNLFRIITLTDTEGHKTELRMYHFPQDSDIDEDENSAIVTEQQFNRDRCYGMVNNNVQKFYFLQFNHFDRQLQPLSYFRIK